jgi:AbiV family abortive infection protein
MDENFIIEIIRGTILSFENGFSLFKAAKLLFKNKFYSISVAMCILSIEELGKTHIISRSIYLDNSEKKERNKWYYNINKSGAAIYSFKYAKDFIEKGNILLENELDSLLNAKISNKIKEIGIYVDIDTEGIFYSPRDIIDKKMAKDYLKFTGEIVDSYCERYIKIKRANLKILLEYYKEIISLGEKYEINKIQDKESYNTDNIAKLKGFGNEAKEIAGKYNL